MQKPPCLKVIHKYNFTFKFQEVAEKTRIDFVRILICGVYLLGVE